MPSRELHLIATFFANFISERLATLLAKLVGVRIRKMTFWTNKHHLYRLIRFALESAVGDLWSVGSVGSNLPHLPHLPHLPVGAIRFLAPTGFCSTLSYPKSYLIAIFFFRQNWPDELPHTPKTTVLAAIFRMFTRRLFIGR